MQIVTQWVKTRINKLVEKEIGLGTEVEQDDFKIVIEQFAKQMEGIAREIDNAVKLY